MQVPVPTVRNGTVLLNETGGYDEQVEKSVLRVNLTHWMPDNSTGPHACYYLALIPMPSHYTKHSRQFEKFSARYMTQESMKDIEFTTTSQQVHFLSCFLH